MKNKVALHYNITTRKVSYTIPEPRKGSILILHCQSIFIADLQTNPQAFYHAEKLNIDSYSLLTGFCQKDSEKT